MNSSDKIPSSIRPPPHIESQGVIQSKQKTQEPKPINVDHMKKVTDISEDESQGVEKEKIKGTKLAGLARERSISREKPSPNTPTKKVKNVSSFLVQEKEVNYPMVLYQQPQKKKVKSTKTPSPAAAPVIQKEDKPKEYDKLTTKELQSQFNQLTHDLTDAKMLKLLKKEISAFEEIEKLLKEYFNANEEGKKKLEEQIIDEAHIDYSKFHPSNEFIEFSRVFRSRKPPFDPALISEAKAKLIMRFKSQLELASLRDELLKRKGVNQKDIHSKFKKAEAGMQVIKNALVEDISPQKQLYTQIESLLKELEESAGKRAVEGKEFLESYKLIKELQLVQIGIPNEPTKEYLQYSNAVTALGGFIHNYHLILETLQTRFNRDIEQLGVCKQNMSLLKELQTSIRNGFNKIHDQPDDTSKLKGLMDQLKELTTKMGLGENYWKESVNRARRIKFLEQQLSHVSIKMDERVKMEKEIEWLKKTQEEMDTSQVEEIENFIQEVDKTLEAAGQKEAYETFMLAAQKYRDGMRAYMNKMQDHEGNFIQLDHIDALTVQLKNLKKTLPQDKQKEVNAWLNSIESRKQAFLTKWELLDQVVKTK